jgi:hypothetical protein
MTHPAPTGDPAAEALRLAEACEMAFGWLTMHGDNDSHKAARAALESHLRSALAPRVAPDEALLQLECAVMNLPSDARKQYPQIAAAAERAAYLIGHREVRHAAAGLIAATAAALRSAPRVALTEEPWQPIETAPKDGNYILVCNCRGAWIAHWAPVAVSGYRFDDPWRSVMLNHDHIAPTARYLPPTHWMPIPTPPAGIGTGSTTP